MSSSLTDPGAPRLQIRPAAPDDLDVVLSLIRELAEYESLVHTVRVDGPALHDLMFGPRPVAGACLAFIDRVPAGFVLFYENVSTFLGCRGLFIEDLYVRPDFRKQGIGLALLKEAARAPSGLRLPRPRCLPTRTSSFVNTAFGGQRFLPRGTAFPAVAAAIGHVLSGGIWLRLAI